MNSQECDISCRISIASSGPNSTSNTAGVFDRPGGGLGGCEFLVEDVIELGNPTLIAHEVAHGV